MMNRMTTLGLDERLERVLAYAFLWVSGIILFFVEKNRNVRWHAAQSMLAFGSLGLLSFAVNILRGLLGWIPLLGGLVIAPGLGLLLSLIWWVTVILWIWLMVMAWLHPDYRLPIVSKWADAWA